MTTEILTCLACAAPLRGRQQKYCSERCGSRSRNLAFYARNRFEERSKRNSARSDEFERHMLYGIRHRAKRAGIPFDIGVEDIRVPYFCPVLGIKIETAVGKGSGYHPNNASVDTIIPEKGYTKGNVRVISSRANLLKNDATSHEIRLILEDLIRLGL